MMYNAFRLAYTVILSFLLTGAYIAFTNSYAATPDNEPLSEAYPKGHWIIDPRQPEESLPPVGRSLFDFLFTENKAGEISYRIPFPYEELIRQVEKQVQTDHLQKSPVKQVLIPLGRSLARNIARPDFFLYPRVVSVVDTEPSLTSTNPGMMLKDRLYIGYGEAAEILEIISYNEAAGRFEFQIVTDYKPGGTPKVFYANREICRACHQNGALIFSRQQWDETNSNPRIAALLNAHQSSFYGIPVDRGVDIPFAIDAATDRANLFSLYQLLWQKGCEPAEQNSARDAVQCRSDLLTSVLQFLLSNRNYYDNQSARYQEKSRDPMKSNWKKYWPDGLLIPDPDIPNRDPLLIKANLTTFEKVDNTFSSKVSATLNTMLSKNEVSEKFEPLKFRPPADIWSVDSLDLNNNLVAGLASFIPTSDVIRLDSQLNKLPAAKLLLVELQCKLESDTIKTTSQRIKFEGQSKEPRDHSEIALKGRFFLNGSQWQNGKISRIDINAQTLFDLPIEGTRTKNQNGGFSTKLKIYTPGDFDNRTTGLLARTPAGNTIDSITLTWRNKVGVQPITASLFIRQDFEQIKAAITNLAALTRNNSSDVLASRPFRRATIVGSLMDSLGAPKTNWCCVNDAGMPAAKLQDPENEVVIVSQEANHEIAPFYHYCSACHRTSNSQPPNFLQGDEQQVSNNMTQCAERIFFRLSMWQQKVNERTKSPMPPDTALNRLGFTHRSWTSSDELLSLKHAASRLIVSKTGSEPDLQRYIDQGFDNLPECLSKGL